MRFLLSLFILLFCSLFFAVFGQMSTGNVTLLKDKSADTLLPIPTNPIRATALILGTNMAIWSYDNFVTRADYARINVSTIRSNLKTGFVWDNDVFICNLFSHPYNGGLYFNAARSNGLNFWQSAPFTAAGSLIWEFFLENEPASINDFTTTTIGGMCLGETTFRISDMLIDDGSIGFERIGREALLTVISPLRELNRLINGDAWKVRRKRGNSLPLPPFSFYSSVGYRALRDLKFQKNGTNNMLRLDLGFIYGDVFESDKEKPYETFKMNLGCNFLSKEPIFNEISAVGTLFSRNIAFPAHDAQMVWGIFQHFNYYEAGLDTVSATSAPFRVSEAASAGPGVLWKVRLSGNSMFSGSVYLSGILLGGCQTDYYEYRKRYYNMGSGFSPKMALEFKIAKKSEFFLNTEYYRIYSWIGYKSNENANITMNVQGDAGNASIAILRFGLNYLIEKQIVITAETGWYYRKNIYRYYPVVERSFEDFKLSLGYVLKN